MPVQEFLGQALDGSVDSWSLHFAKINAYETLFGIHNHAVDKPRPLALLEMNPKENHISYSALDRAIHRYYNLKMWDFTHMTVWEFLNQPRYYVELSYSIAERQARRGNGVMNELQNALKLNS